MTRLPLAEYLGEPGPSPLRDARRSTSFKSNIALPGVFEANPFRFPMGTVWTLKYEVLCYARGARCSASSGALRLPLRRARPRRWPRPCAGRASTCSMPDAPQGRRDRLAAAPHLRLRGGPLRLAASRSGSPARRRRPAFVATWLASGAPSCTRRLSSSPRPMACSGSPRAGARPPASSSRAPISPTGPISTAGRCSSPCTRSLPAAAALVLLGPALGAHARRRGRCPGSSSRSRRLR